MRELRETIKKRLREQRSRAASAGDYRDWDGATEAHAAIGELEWVLRQIDGAVEADPTRLFTESVRFEQDVTFDGDVYVVGNMTVKGTLTAAGFNVE